MVRKQMVLDEIKNIEAMIQQCKDGIERCNSGKFTYSKSQYEGYKYMLNYYEVALEKIKGEV